MVNRTMAVAHLKVNGSIKIASSEDSGTLALKWSHSSPSNLFVPSSWIARKVATDRKNAPTAMSKTRFNGT